MKIIEKENSPAFLEAEAAKRRIHGQDYDYADKKVLVRFERGVDFQEVDDLVTLIMSLLNDEKPAQLVRNLQRMKEMAKKQGVSTMGSELYMDIAIPEAALDRTRLAAHLSADSLH